jgi:hypothetical protein
LAGATGEGTIGPVYADLREFIDQVEALGALRRIDVGTASR